MSDTRYTCPGDDCADWLMSAVTYTAWLQELGFRPAECGGHLHRADWYEADD